MLYIFESLKFLIKVRTVVNDGIVFRLHYRFTVLFLLSGCILLSCKQYFGDPIECVVDKNIKKVFEDYCWTHSTYILPSAWNETVGVGGVPHPGIDTTKPGAKKVYHAYYQWVAFMLLFQAVLFYFPRYLWKTWEKGFMRSFSLDLQCPVVNPSDCTKKYQLLSHTLQSHWGNFSGYFHRYLFCEFLTLINVLGQMWLLNTFFGGAFMTFGTRVIQWSEWDYGYRTDPLVEVFPRMTKCIFHYYGPSGDVKKVDGLCILPLNILNEKIFIFLWFWMVILSSLTVATLIYRLFLAIKPSVRYSILVTRAPHADKTDLERIVQSSDLSDWFVMYMLSENLSSEHYRNLISLMASTVEKHGHVPQPSSNEEEAVSFV